MKKWFLKNYKNYICLVLAIIVLAFASVFFNNSYFGSDSIFALNQGLSRKLGLEIGTTNLIIGVVAFIILLIIDRKSIGVGTVLMALTMGPVIDIVLKLGIIPDLSTLKLDNDVLLYILKFLYIVIAIIIGGFGIALYIYSNRGISPLEGILIKIQKVTKIPFWLVKIINDVIFYFIGFILGAEINIGSIMAAFLYGPTINMFLKLFNKIAFLDKQVVEEEVKERKKKKKHEYKKIRYKKNKKTN